MAHLTDHIVFRNAALAKQFANKLIPIDTLFESYFDGELDIPGDISLLLRDRHAVARHHFTPAHVKYFLTKFVPEFAVHSKSYDQKLVRGHYDLVWGLFMAKYIFQGADASLPAAPMINYMERAGFEIHSVENVTEHYRLTIRRWHDNWLKHREETVANYGERWYRIWHVFLAWAATVAGQGTAACFQVVSNKNRNDFDRTIWIGKPSLAERMHLSAAMMEQPSTNGTTIATADCL